MSHAASPLATFHRVGDRSELAAVVPVDSNLRPALFGSYHDLAKLRYDFPLVLVTSTSATEWVISLSDIIDNALRAIAPPGAEGEETRKQLLALEQAIRARVSEGQRGLLSTLWEEAQQELTTGSDLGNTLQAAWTSAGLDGQVIDCDENLATRLLTHAWQQSEQIKAERLHVRVERLAQKLADVLEVDFMHSPAARKAERLEASMGPSDNDVFDFEAMSRLLKSTPSVDPLPAARRQRIEEAIRVLGTQQFVTAPGADTSATEKSYGFAFDNCDQALQAFRDRLPEVASLVRAISIAELEIDNHYVEARHDRFFESFDQDQLGPADIRMFPRYQVCLSSMNAGDRADVLGILAAGLPFNILAQTRDVLGDSSIQGGRLSFGLHGQHLAQMAMGMEQVFVMQAANSTLYRLRSTVERGMHSERPALFSIFAGAGYLESAAATESRAFPCFSHDPASGKNRATRFSLEGNPLPDANWTGHTIHYETTGLSIEAAPAAFTLIDFIAAHPAQLSHFACVPQEDWSYEMITADRFLDLPARQREAALPYVWLIDANDVLLRAVVDEKLVDAAERCLHAWKMLQELGGINNSYAAAAVAEARLTWEQEHAQLPAPTEPAVAGPQPSGTAQTQPATVEQAEPEPVAATAATPSPNEAWIESIRCTTCNECTELNDRLFAYDGEMRAYIADPDAGTFRELVEAAETCQVAIIHPGKPRNPDEAGLEELIKRAEPFI
jgi:hypothetical protein